MPSLAHTRKFFGLTTAGISRPEVVQPMAIKDKKRFAELDALIRAGYGDMRQDDIPDAVMIAAEEGEEITEQGPARDRRFAKSVEEPPQRPPIKRKITPEARA